MPTLYGEGRNAFYRLQEEIMRTSTDTSLIAWGSPTMGDRIFKSWEEFEHIVTRSDEDGERVLDASFKYLFTPSPSSFSPFRVISTTVWENDLNAHSSVSRYFSARRGAY